MPLPTLEGAVLETLVPEMEAEGFDVYVHPQPKHVPEFLRDLRPDVLAYKGDKKVVVEVVGGGGGREPQAEHVRRRLVGHPDWELRVVYAAPRSATEDIPASSREVIEGHLDRIEGALDVMGAPAALLAAWAALEASARLLIPDGLGRPQTSSRLLEVLASQGHVTPDEADALRALGRVRDGVAHGRLDLTVSRHEVDQLVRIARSLLSNGGHAPAEARG